MKYTILFCLVIGFNVSLEAQKIDYNRVIIPEGAGNVEFGERLVQLAWENHPANHIAQREVAVQDYNTKLSGTQWYDIIEVSGNLNEFNFSEDEIAQTRAQFFPKYNVRASIPLSIFTRIPYQKKQNRLLTSISEDRVKAKKLEVRRIVLENYNNYLMFQEIHNIQTRALQDAESSHQIMEESFKQGESTFDAYTASLNNFNKSKIDKLKAQKDYLNSKLVLEELIGIPLSEVNR